MELRFRKDPAFKGRNDKIPNETNGGVGREKEDDKNKYRDGQGKLIPQ